MTWLAGVTAGVVVVALSVPAVTATAASSGYGHGHRPYINCSDNTRGLCQEVGNSYQAFGRYVGHDEPTVLFYSHVRGSGNQMVYKGILPKEPPPTNVPGKHTYDFQLYPAFWFGMVMCATQSAPLTVKSCAPDSDRNITRPGRSVPRRSGLHGAAVLPARIRQAVERLQLLGHQVVCRPDHRQLRPEFLYRPAA